MPRPPKPELPVFVVTPEQQERAKLFEELEGKIESLKETYYKDLRELRANVPKCKPHIWILPKSAKYEYFNQHWSLCERVYCAVCGADGGWFCPVNPTHACVYEDRYDEYCIHCGAPDERK